MLEAVVIPIISGLLGGGLILGLVKFFGTAPDRRVQRDSIIAEAAAVAVGSLRSELEERLDELRDLRNRVTEIEAQLDEVQAERDQFLDALRDVLHLIRARFGDEAADIGDVRRYGLDPSILRDNDR